MAAIGGHESLQDFSLGHKIKEGLLNNICMCGNTFFCLNFLFPTHTNKTKSKKEKNQSGT